MEKTKVVIASILKPIDDTRMYEKFGLSMAKTNKYDINIIGFTSKNVKPYDSIEFHPLGQFSRISWKRFFAPLKVFKILVKVKPQLVICNTHELLIVTWLYRILFGAKIVYDIRENYYKNIRYTQVFPPLLRPFIATWVRIKERLAALTYHQFIMAERVYKEQMLFIPERAVVIENKYKPMGEAERIARPLLPDTLDLIITGTISRSNGVFEAISIAKSLHEIDSQIRLKIVGYCALKADLVALQEQIKDLEFIELIGGDFLVPHPQIVEEISKADYGFVLKKPNNGVNDDKVLTRLFEYTANHLPILLLNNPHWVSFCQEYNAAIPIDPAHYEAKALLATMKSGEFYTMGDTNNSLWNNEEPKLLSTISKLLS